jgi:tetratricopeptide (TPR) repeat protein
VAASGDSPANTKPLFGQVLFLYGRVHGVTRRRLDQLVRSRGGRLVSKPTARVTLIALAHSAACKALPDGYVSLPAGLPSTATMLSEREFRRRLGILPPPPLVDRSLRQSELERLSGLGSRVLSCLALFDVLEPVDERYAYRDLVAAREAGRLLARGVELRRVLEAAITLCRRGSHLAETRLTDSGSGELLRELSGQLAELSGQLTMPLEHDVRSIDELVTAAEKAEESKDLVTAENLYTTALRADSNDPVIPFNLGNAFAAQERSAEAKIAWQIAVARDPAFAEAWYNLAMAAEDEEYMDLAIAQYRRAVQARPDFSDAHFNLALLLTKHGRYDEALLVWHRFLDLEPGSKHAITAKRATTLCRMALKQKQPKTG